MNESYFASAYRGLRYRYFKLGSFYDLLKALAISFIAYRYRYSGSGPALLKSTRINNRADLRLMESDFFSSINNGVLVEPKIVFNFLWIPVALRFYREWRRGDKFLVSPRDRMSKLILFFYGIHIASSLACSRVVSGRIYVFCDCVGLDAALAYFYASKGSYVVSIQHGQYRYQPEKINSDILPFINYSAHEIWVWGQRTKDEYDRAGVSGCNVVVAGRFGGGARVAIDVSDLRYICVVLNGPDSEEVNFKLISLAKDYSLKFSLPILVKRHPADRKNYDFELYCADNESSCIFLCYTSGFIIESMLISRPVAIYNDGMLPNVYQGLPMCVKSVDELNDLALIRDVNKWNDIYSLVVRGYISNA